VRFAPEYLETIERGPGGIECVKLTTGTEVPLPGVKYGTNPAGFTIEWWAEPAKGGDVYIAQWRRKLRAAPP
jgi:hypothetical protein